MTQTLNAAYFVISAAGGTYNYQGALNAYVLYMYRMQAMHFQMSYPLKTQANELNCAPDRSTHFG